MGGYLYVERPVELSVPPSRSGAHEGSCSEVLTGDRVRPDRSPLGRADPHRPGWEHYGRGPAVYCPPRRNRPSEPFAAREALPRTVGPDALRRARCAGRCLRALLARRLARSGGPARTTSAMPRRATLYEKAGERRPLIVGALTSHSSALGE